MNPANSLEYINKIIEQYEMVFVYFGSESCNVCLAMKPKLEEVLKSYPLIKSIDVNVEKAAGAAAVFNVFTIPAILVFINGRETIREARYISIGELNSKISRYYNLLFEQ